MTEQVPLDIHVDRLWELLEDGFHARCESREIAEEFTQRLYDEYPDDVFHIEHYPATNDEDGAVEFTRLIVRRLHYDRDTGWISVHVPTEPNYVVKPADPDQETLTLEDTNEYAEDELEHRDEYHPVDESVVQSDGGSRDYVTVWSADDVDFVPERFFPNISDYLTVATASNLLREFADCPECGHDIDPDVADGKQEDRDVVWRGEDDDLNSDYHTCEECGATLKLFVEEKARPAHWSKIPDEHWARHHLWIEMDDGTYFVTNPAHISATTVTTEN